MKSLVYPLYAILFLVLFGSLYWLLEANYEDSFQARVDPSLLVPPGNKNPLSYKENNSKLEDLPIRIDDLVGSSRVGLIDGDEKIDITRPNFSVKYDEKEHKELQINIENALYGSVCNSDYHQSLCAVFQDFYFGEHKQLFIQVKDTTELKSFLEEIGNQISTNRFSANLSLEEMARKKKNGEKLQTKNLHEEIFASSGFVGTNCQTTFRGFDPQKDCIALNQDGGIFYVAKGEAKKILNYQKNDLVFLKQK